MEDMEHVSLGDSFRREVANKQPGAHRESIPKTFCHIDSFVVQELVIFLLDLWTPWRIIVTRLGRPTLLFNTAFLGGYRRLLQGALRFSTGRWGLREGGNRSLGPSRGSVRWLRLGLGRDITWLG
jgi:hypothetical protein